MAKPQFHYVIAPNAVVAYAHNGRAIIVQQTDPLGSEGGAPDAKVIVDRDEAAKLRDALADWLKATA